MSDRYIAQDCVFQHYRASVQPNFVENWDARNEDIQSTFIKVNDFFCGLYFLVGLADQSISIIKGMG